MRCCRSIERAIDTIRPGKWQICSTFAKFSYHIKVIKKSLIIESCIYIYRRILLESWSPRIFDIDRARRGKNFVVDNIGIIYTREDGWSGKIIKVGYAAKLLHDSRRIHPRDVHSIALLSPLPFFLSLQTFFFRSPPPLRRTSPPPSWKRWRFGSWRWSKAWRKTGGGGSQSVGRSVGFGKGIAKSWFASGRRIHSGESRRDGITNERVAPDCKIEFELAALWEWIWDEDEDWNQFGYGNFRRTFSYFLSSRFSDFKISRETLMITQLSRLIPDFFFFKFWFFVFFFKSRWSYAGSVRIILRTKSKTNNYLQRRRLFLI